MTLHYLKCDCEMTEKPLGGVMTDRCPQRAGIWLDGGELERSSSDRDTTSGTGRQPRLPERAETMRASHTILVTIVSISLLAACKQLEPAPPDLPADLADTWRSETIPLPSQFAPGLPRGVEELRFAPGMYKSDAPDYWSYIFVLRFEEKIDGSARVKDILEQYYTGLITAVAKRRNVPLDRPAAQVKLETVTDRKFRANVDLIDAFVTGKPVVVHMDIELKTSEKGTALLAAVSPQPRTHDVWRSLKFVLEAIE
jgi:Zn-finger nucleic acid-binding protein